MCVSVHNSMMSWLISEVENPCGVTVNIFRGRLVCERQRCKKCSKTRLSEKQEWEEKTQGKQAQTVGLGCLINLHITGQFSGLPETYWWLECYKGKINLLCNVRSNMNIVVDFLHAQRGELEICLILECFCGKKENFLMPGSYAFICCWIHTSAVQAFCYWRIQNEKFLKSEISVFLHEISWTIPITFLIFAIGTSATPSNCERENHLDPFQHWDYRIFFFLI